MPAVRRGQLRADAHAGGVRAVPGGHVHGAGGVERAPVHGVSGQPLPAAGGAGQRQRVRAVPGGERQPCRDAVGVRLPGAGGGGVPGGAGGVQQRDGVRAGGVCGRAVLQRGGERLVGGGRVRSVRGGDVRRGRQRVELRAVSCRCGWVFFAALCSGAQQCSVVPCGAVVQIRALLRLVSAKFCMCF